MANGDTSTRPDEAQSPVAKPHHGNPYLKHLERAAYELPRLLRLLPSMHAAPLTNETYQIAEAAAHHARNGMLELLSGLEALGGLMVDLDEIGDHYRIKANTVSALGDLIKHIAVEVQFLKDTETAMQEAISERDQQVAKGDK